MELVIPKIDIDLYNIDLACKNPFSTEVKLICDELLKDKAIFIIDDLNEFTFYTFSKIKNKNLYVVFVIYIQFLFQLDDHLEKNHEGISVC